MISVLHIARYILEKGGTMPAMKLQKLCYYAQAWSLVWDEVPLFYDEIQAWANGPVCPALYREHEGLFILDEPEVIKGNAAVLCRDARDTVDGVLESYGDRSSQWLSDLVHREYPWRDARKGLAPGERGSRPILWAALGEYYASLPPD